MLSVVAPMLAAMMRRLPLVHWRVWDVQRRFREFFAPRYVNYPRDWTEIRDFDGNLHMKLRRSTYMGSVIYWQGYQSPAELKVLNRLLKPDTTFVDVGANMGEFTLFAAKRIRSGTVFAFEPVPSLFSLLNENIALNNFSHVQTFNLALSDNSGHMVMYSSVDSVVHTGVNEGLGSIFRSDLRNEMVAEVEVKTLDSLLEGVKRINIIKIDVEGAELLVLRGAQETIRQHKPAILIEINRNALKAAGHTPDMLLDELAELGYRFELIRNNRAGSTIPLNRTAIPDLCNVLCRWDR